MLNEHRSRWTVNGASQEVNWTVGDRLIDVLRRELGLIAVKEGCGEGECGACSVLVDAELKLSCLMMAAAVPDGATVVTAEGFAALPAGEALERAFVAAGAVQCGYCTPGMLAAGYHALTHPGLPVRLALSGNLCRCTGYSKILAAVDGARAALGSQGVVASPRVSAAAAIIASTSDLSIPRDIDEALAMRAAHPDAVVLAGGTDLVAAFTTGQKPPGELLVLGQCLALAAIERGIGGQSLRIGALATHAAIAAHQVICADYPALAEAAANIGAPAIRNMGTLGGNLVTASPAADLPPALMAYSAEVIVASFARGERRIPLEQFFVSYRQTALAKDELVLGVELPPPQKNLYSRFFKVGSRKAQACSKATLAVAISEREGRVADVRIAAGSVGPTVMRLVAAEKVLRGERLTEALAEAAASQARSEIAPIDDLRSSADYRRHVVGGLLARALTERI